MLSYLIITFYWIWWIMFGLMCGHVLNPQCWTSYVVFQTLILSTMCCTRWYVASCIGLICWTCSIDLALMNMFYGIKLCSTLQPVISCVMVIIIYCYIILWSHLSMLQNILLFTTHACFVLPTGTTEKINLAIDVETKWERDVYIFVKQMTQLVKKVSLLC